MPLIVTNVELDADTLIWETIRQYRGTSPEILCKLARRELDKLKVLWTNPEVNQCAICAAMIRAIAFKKLIKKEAV